MTMTATATTTAEDRINIRMPLHWRQPIQPSAFNASSGGGGGGGGGGESMILPSFPQLQLKTHQTLYGGGRLSSPSHHSSSSYTTTNTTMTTSKSKSTTSTPLADDKSPKGFVDGPIRHLVDLINHHSHYCTLSSCSGRLSVFDPQHHDCGGGSGTGNSGNSDSVNDGDDNRGDGEGGERSDHETTTTTTRPMKTLYDNDQTINGNDGDDIFNVSYRSGRRRSSRPRHLDHNDITGSGKGSTGRWILVSHYLVDPQQLIDCLKVVSGGAPEKQQPQQSQSCKVLKFEPLLLHVAAASLHHGRCLLKLALDLGFRESGLVVTDTRVTVAIRGHSLALAVPLFGVRTSNDNSNKTSSSSSPSSSSSSHLSLSTEYLTALVLECNRRLQANWVQLDRLYDIIATHLFQLRCDKGGCITVRRKHNPNKECFQPSTSLNLWNTTAVATVVACRHNGSNQEGEKDEDVETMDANTRKQSEIWVVGGYGKGPDLRSNGVNQVSRSNNLRRSNAMYRLTQISDWEAVKVDDNHSHGQKDSFRIDIGTLPVSWLSASEYPDLQGMASCQLSGNNGLVILWGGRRGPTKPSPSETLYVLDPPRCRLGKVTIASSSQCELPRPRWGHSLLALDNGNRAVLLGGCNEEDGGMDDVWILHQMSEGFDGDCHFEWKKLDVTLPTPRFHFGSVLLENDTIMILGGLTSTKEILNPFEVQPHDETKDCAPWALRVEEPSQQQQTLGSATTYSEVGVQVKNGTFDGSLFGMACCTLKSKHLLMVSGGISTADDDRNKSPPIQAYWITNKGQTKCVQLERIPLQLDANQKKTMDFGSLVHHSCLAVGDDEMVLVGGGVSSFAFGETYAKSHHLWIDFGGVNGSDGNGSGGDDTVSLEATVPSIDNEPTTATVAAPATKPKARVIYTSPSDAKKVKNVLEANGWLDKRFRMIKMTEKDNSMTMPRSPLIAVPIAISADQLLLLSDDSSLKKEWIVGHGYEELPWSSSQIASLKNKNRR